MTSAAKLADREQEITQHIQTHIYGWRLPWLSVFFLSFFGWQLFRQTATDQLRGCAHSQSYRGSLIFASLLSTVDSARRQGRPSRGHDDQSRQNNMGCKARGQPCQPYSLKTGHGYVKAHRGFYHDAIFVKRNNFNLLLHETFGGVFSRTVVLKLRRLARKVARGVDRTAYSPKYSLSFRRSTMQQRISLSVCEARTAPFALTWQPCLHVSRAREQGSRPQIACEC